MLTLLQEYLTINTAYPFPDYHAAITLFKKQALADGFLINELIMPSGNPVLVITLQGSSCELLAIALNHHMDVVPANNVDEWKFPPFGGIVHENIIHGRGTQDCKGLGVVHYAALRHFKQHQLRPKRTIHFIMVPDEERGGFHGTKEFIEHPFFTSLNIGYVLDEGLASGNNKELLIKVDERTPLQILVTSLGQQSHASGLYHHNSIHTLMSFLAKIAAFNGTQQKNTFADAAGTVVSMHITSLKTDNDALNVIPSKAHATIDIRIPSHLSLDDGITLIDELLQKNTTVTYEILATSRERVEAIPFDSIFYQTLVQSIVDYGLKPKSFSFEATTDARFYSHKGIQTLGFTPFSTTPNLHGTNESIRIKDFEQGITIFSNFLNTFCIFSKELS